MVVPPQSCKATAPTIHSAASTPGELAMWRGLFDEAIASKLANPGSLADVVVKRFPKGEFFVMMPRGNRAWDVHNSYHLDGTKHMKSRSRKVLSIKSGQPLTDATLSWTRSKGPLTLTRADVAPAISGAVRSDRGPHRDKSSPQDLALAHPHLRPAGPSGILVANGPRRIRRRLQTAPRGGRVFPRSA
jgi:hypothetical protein